MTTAVVTMWGNSHALRIPSKMVKTLGIARNDKVYLEASDEKIIITKVPAPKKGTLEYLFKDYSGESFKTILANPMEPAGNEKW
ncbi:MAG: AbrB/MazE/SpoVT family DNA-binding domain-containing protein [Treponema sp.]|nr:AbrB/MazE/SpoVT family DNA-binding domain-containing protein [Treponema sp.]